MRAVGESEMVGLGRRWARCLQPGTVASFRGDLGAGKTTLVRGLLEGLGYKGIVRSPTFTLIESYTIADISIHHFDLYRVEDPEELELIGCRDYLNNQDICLVEWPDKGGDLFSSPAIAFEISHTKEGRDVAYRLFRDDPCWTENEGL